MTLDDLIREHAGKKSITQIAAMANVSDQTARRHARDLGIDTNVPAYAPEDKATYSVRPPLAESAEFAEMINDLMDKLDLRTQNAAWCAALRYAHEMNDIDGGE